MQACAKRDESWLQNCLDSRVLSPLEHLLLSLLRHIMKTFVIHTPKPIDQSGNRSFEATIETSTGEEFAIYPNAYDPLHEGMPLIVLDKLQRQQAEAIVTRIEFQPNATKRVARYNVLFHNPRRVAYRGDEVKLNRCGVALLDS